MKSNIYKRIHNIIVQLREWTQFHYLQLAIFNVVLVLLVLLRSAGYFEPFFSITINLIFITALILAVSILSMRNRATFLIGLIFWLLAAFFKFFSINTWAERTALYSYEALVIGMLLFLFENFLSTRKN